MPEWAWPSSGIVYLFNLISRFHVDKNIKQTYKGGLHFTVIRCTNKCIINESYIPEHQNKLNILVYWLRGVLMHPPTGELLGYFLVAMGLFYRKKAC